MSNRVFKMKDNTLYCVSGDQTYYHLDPKETTLILLSARPYKGKPGFYFDPGHA